MMNVCQYLCKGVPPDLGVLDVVLLAENVAAGGNNSAGERVPQVLRPDLQEAADGGEEALLLDRGAVLFLYKKKFLCYFYMTRSVN